MEYALIDDPRIRALELQQQALVQLALQLDAAVRELLGEVKAWRAESQAQAASTPLSSALIALMQSIGQDPWARRILAGAFAILLLSLFSIPANSLLFPVLQVLEKWVSTHAGATP